MVLSRRACSLLLCLACVTAISLVTVQALDSDQGISSLFSRMASTEETEAWPDLVGMDKDEAKAKLERAFPNLKVFTVGQDRVVTMDYRRDRVRIFHNNEGSVVRVPRLG
ncbi:hypothetical protein ACKKBG_A31040 [Auxenochlorella protothecoides x Auxenochlorella symbiontica]